MTGATVSYHLSQLKKSGADFGGAAEKIFIYTVEHQRVRGDDAVDCTVFRPKGREGKKMKNNRLWRGAVFVLTLLPVAELLTAIALLPDTVAVHWGLDGTPDRYSSRFELLIPVATFYWWVRFSGSKAKGAAQRDFGQAAWVRCCCSTSSCRFCCMSPSTRRSTCRVFPLEKIVSWTGRGGGTGGGELPAEGPLGSTG